MATITKKDLVLRLSNETNLTQQQVFGIVQKLLEAVTSDLAQGHRVVMRNFGTFEVRRTKAKVGRNPMNPGQDIPIPPRAIVKFMPGKELKEKVAQRSQEAREGKDADCEKPCTMTVAGS